MRLKYLSAFAAVSFLLAACVKERGNNFANQSSPASNTVDFINQTESAALDIQTTPTLYTFYVELNSTENTYPSTTVTITKNASAVAAKGYEFLPDSAYQLVNTTATIDPTTHLAAFQIRITTTKIDLTRQFGVGFSIASATNGVIATNKNTIVVSIGAKNRYDGVYRLKGYHNRTPYDFPYDTEESLITLNGNSVSMYWNSASSVGHPIGTGVGVTSWYGATIAPVIVFDNTTNLVTNVYNSDPAGPPITKFTGAGSGTGRFDPTTRTIYVYWNYNANPLRAFFDTLTYLRPR